MKSFFIKIFMVVAAALCMLEGLVLVAVGLGRLSPEKLQVLYTNLIAVPKALSTIAGVGMFFVVLGFILLVLSSRTKPAPKVILVEKEGKALTIPQATIKDFIRQIIEQDSFVNDFNINFEEKKTGIEIRIAIALNGVPSIYQELSQIEEVLRMELERVFEWKAFKFNFQVRGVGVDPKKKYFPSSEPEPQPRPAEEIEEPAESLGDLIEPEEEKEEEIVPAVRKKLKGKDKDKPKDSSFLSKMLWGK